MNSVVQLPPFWRGEVYDVHAQALPYHLADTRMPQHWQHTMRGKGIRVGVADTGIDLEHPEIAGRVIDGKSFVSRRFSNDFFDGNDHGHHVASIIAGKNVGVAPAAELVIAKVLRDNGSGSNDGVAKGIDYLNETGCHIINLSLGGPVDDSRIREAIKRAIDAGKIIVAATGNEQAGHVSYPARHCIGVGAVDRDLKLAYFSNRGKHVDLVGYGVDVYAAIPGGRYMRMSGTSMATPFIAGLIANRLSAELHHTGAIQTDSHEKLLELETKVVDLGPAGKDTSYGRGFPDLDRGFYDNLRPSDPKPDPTGTIHARVEDVGTGRFWTGLLQPTEVSNDR